jgi:hypothetical protein
MSSPTSTSSNSYKSSTTSSDPSSKTSDVLQTSTMPINRSEGRDVHIYDAKNPTAVFGGLILSNGVTNVNLYSKAPSLCRMKGSSICRMKRVLELSRIIIRFNLGNTTLSLSVGFYITHSRLERGSTTNMWPTRIPDFVCQSTRKPFKSPFSYPFSCSITLSWSREIPITLPQRRSCTSGSPPSHAK